MKVLTVQQPWAWAIIHGGKTVENRTQAWKYRGPLAIHAGSRLSERGLRAVPNLLGLQERDSYQPGDLVTGAIIGVTRLVDVHPAEVLEHPHDDDVAVATCCESPWAEVTYQEASGRTRYQVVHLVLEDATPITPIPCPGRLGLWTPPPHVLDQLAEA
jgi:hypothetical protein